MADSFLYETVCRKIIELLLKVGYMELIVDRVLNCESELVT